MKIQQLPFKILRKQNVMDGYTDNVKTVYPPQSKFAVGIKKILKTNGSLMKVKNIAECSLGIFCNSFDLH